MAEPGGTGRHPGATRAIVVVLAAAVGFGVWWLFIRSTTKSVPCQATATATAVSQQCLQTLAGSSPIYWAGPQPDVTFELTEGNGRTYLRYLPSGVASGSPDAYLTIGTYSFPNAYRSTLSVADESGSVKLAAPGGAVAFYRRSRPTNVYLAFPGINDQIEVYDPNAAQGQALVTGGSIAAVGGAPTPATTTSAANAAVAVSPSALKQLARTLGSPIYWAGTKSGDTYELRQTASGWVYIRYLPGGVAVGATQPYLTIATYPVENAFSITSDASGQSGTVKIPVTGGGVAFYAKARPNSVYLAFPGVNEQVEVFDPSAALGHRAVAKGEIRQVS
jgi:hypothetical protein